MQVATAIVKLMAQHGGDSDSGDDSKLSSGRSRKEVRAASRLGKKGRARHLRVPCGAKRLQKAALGPAPVPSEQARGDAAAAGRVGRSGKVARTAAEAAAVADLSDPEVDDVDEEDFFTPPPKRQRLQRDLDAAGPSGVAAGASGAAATPPAAPGRLQVRRAASPLSAPGEMQARLAETAASPFVAPGGVQARRAEAAASPTAAPGRVQERLAQGRLQEQGLSLQRLSPLPPPISSTPGASSPAARTDTSLISCLADAIERGRAMGTAGASALAADRQRLVATAIAVRFGHGVLEEPCIAEALQALGQSQASGGDGASSPHPRELLPMHLIGAVFAWSEEEVAAILREVTAGRRVPVAASKHAMRVQLLAWAIGVPFHEALGKPPPRQPNEEELLFMMTEGGPQLEASGFGDPMTALVEAFQLVQKEGTALVAVAACLAQAGKEKEGVVPAGSTDRATPGVDGLLRLVGKAMAVNGGGGGGFSALATASQALMSQGTGCGLFEASAQQIPLPDLSSIPREVALPKLAYDAITEAMPQLMGEAREAGQAGELRKALTKPALFIGVSLHSSGCVDLSKGISQALVLAYSPAWRLPLQAAVAAVAESMAPGGPGVELVMQLMGEMRGMGAV